MIPHQGMGKSPLMQSGFLSYVIGVTGINGNLSNILNTSNPIFDVYEYVIFLKFGIHVCSITADMYSKFQKNHIISPSLIKLYICDDISDLLDQFD